MISAKVHPKKFIDVLGRRMAYVELGAGDPIVFQHGNPKSSFTIEAPRLPSTGRATTGVSVKGICYMEAIVCPVNWADWPEAARAVFQGFRSPAGEDMVLQKNIFVERVLPGSIRPEADRR